MTPFLKRNVIRIGVAFLVVSLYSELALSPLGDTMDNLLLRELFSLRGPRSVPQSVALVRLDKRSYRRLGLLREGSVLPLVSQAIEKINAAGPKLIILDFLLERPAKESEANARFIKALSDSPSVIGSGVDEYIDTDLTGERTLSVERVQPHESFANAAKAVSHLLVRTTSSVVTRMSLSDDESYQRMEKVPLLKPLRKLVSPDLEEPGDYDVINYYGEPYGIPDVPLYRLIGPGETVPAEFFKHKVVFVGAVDLPNCKEGKDDTFAVPVSSGQLMWGVEILATIVENLLDKSWIRRLSPQREAQCGVIVLWLLVFPMFCIGLYRGFIYALAMTAAWAVLAYYSFTHWLFLLPGSLVFGVMVPLVLLGMSISAAIGLRGRLTAHDEARTGGL